MSSIAFSEPRLSPEPARAGPAQAQAASVYDAFISYSHALDKPIAAALQSAMQRLGKAWYQRRALRLFRDDTSLTATPHLWPSIEQALGRARFLILLASPEAAASPWVGKELAWWLDHRGPDTVLIAVTAGELDWDMQAGDFRWSEATPLPLVLKGRFADEPRWIDLRLYRDAANPRNHDFINLAADFAAALHGRAKEDLLSQEVRQQRRALRLAGAAVALLLVLLGLAGWQWTVAERAKQAALAAQQQATEQQKIAEAQRDRAEHTLALATQTANGLVFGLAQKFRDSGVSAAVISDVLARARHLQDQLTAGGETSPELRRSQAVGLTEVARELLTIGDTKGSLAAATQARDIYHALLGSTPENPTYRRELSVSFNEIGNVLQVQGDLAGALEAYREQLAVGGELARNDPGNALFQSDLAWAETKVGEVLWAQGDRAGALASYRESSAIRRSLAQKDPSNPELQSELSISDDRIGAVLQEQGDRIGALAAYRDALAILLALARQNPGNTMWQRDLAVSEERIASVLLEQGDLAGALALYSDGLAIRQTLTQKDPGNTEWQLDLSMSDEKIGNVLRKEGHNDGALAAYRDSLAIRKTLAQKDPSNSSWERGLAIIDGKIGEVRQAQGDLAGALAAYRDAVAIFQVLAKKNPDDVQAQTNLVLCLYRLASVGDNSRANLTAALAILERLTAAGQLPPANQNWLGAVAAAIERLPAAQPPD
ncbi:MAG: toll/interleukin-1 receptor domain-containing protein [Alphaproteobacteria bacterium]|nr:toll/interleukin-1 receptor domain-containing protein [Alphaproteobacteria bacterium]